MDNQNTFNEQIVNQNNIEPAKPNKVKVFFFCLWVVAAMLIAQLVVTYAGLAPKMIQAFTEAGGDMAKYQEVYLDKVMSAPELLTYIQVCASLAMALVAVIWYYNGYVKKAKAAGTYKPITKKIKNANQVLFVLFGTLAVYPLACVLQYLGMTLMPNYAAGVSQALNMALGGSAILGLITAVILAPIGEEVAMRGIIVQRAKTAYSVVGVAIISAVLFGVFHLNLIQGIYVLPMGLFWGYVAYRFNSAVPTIIGHFINNLLGMTVALIFNPLDNIWVTVVVFIVLAAISAVFGAKCDYLKDVEQ